MLNKPAVTLSPIPLTIHFLHPFILLLTPCHSLSCHLHLATFPSLRTPHSLQLAPHITSPVSHSLVHPSYKYQSTILSSLDCLVSYAKPSYTLHYCFSLICFIWPCWPVSRTWDSLPALSSAEDCSNFKMSQGKTPPGCFWDQLQCGATQLCTHHTEHTHNLLVTKPL